MHPDEFAQLTDEYLSKVRAKLSEKNKEYTRGDSLENFKHAAALQQCTPERALFGMVAKHIVALFQFIRDLANGTLQPQEVWDEKLVDIMVYMILLAALVRERLNGKALEQVGEEPQCVKR